MSFFKKKPVIKTPAQKLHELTAQFEADFSVLEKSFRDIRKELQKAVDKKKLQEVKKSFSSKS